jgi:hypothetical protein
MRPHKRCFERFAESLSPEESAVVRYWLNMGYQIIQAFQMDGSVPEGYSYQQVKALERHFSSALAKAVVCTETVFRGLSAGGHWEVRPGSMDFLSRLIHGPQEISFPTHDSASLSEEIGRGHCYIDPEDQPRRLSVLLRVRPQTARYLAPFRHQAKDEEEVVLLKGARYRRTGSRRLLDPKSDLEYWQVDLVEEADDGKPPWK